MTPTNLSGLIADRDRLIHILVVHFDMFRDKAEAAADLFLHDKTLCTEPMAQEGGLERLERYEQFTDGWGDEVLGLKQHPKGDYVKYADVVALLASPAPAQQEGGPLTVDLPHPDNIGVDRFAEAMKAKLKWEREKRGRAGWQRLSEEDLSRLLFEHLPKGDPVDVANFCMMLSQNGQSIASPAAPSEEVTDAEVNAVALVFAQHADTFHHLHRLAVSPSTAGWDDFADAEKAAARLAARAALLAALQTRSKQP